MTGLAIQDDGNIFHQNFGITTRCCSAQTPQNYHFVFRMIRNQKPRLRHLMSVLQALTKVHENQEGLKPNVTYQLVRCANENKHGTPMNGELSGIKSKETSVQTCSILGISWFTQWVADDSVFLGHDFASMANGIPTFRDSVMSSSSRDEKHLTFLISVPKILLTSIILTWCRSYHYAQQFTSINSLGSDPVGPLIELLNWLRYMRRNSL
jgi:hypothetical protein